MRSRNIIVIIGFLALLLLPIGHLLKVLSSTSTNGYSNFPDLGLKRTFSASSPKGVVLGLHRDIKKNSQSFTKYFEDNFTWKKRLLAAYKLIHEDIFQENPLPKEVIEGSVGWMFLGDRYSNVVMESKGISTFSESEFDIIEQKILSRDRWLKDQGIASYLLMVPNKHTVFEESIPILKSERPTNLEELSVRLNRLDVGSIDVSKLLRGLRASQTYHKTDSHWNDHGAYYAYSCLMDRIQMNHPEVAALALESMATVTDTAYRMEMARVLDKDIEEVYVSLQKVDSTAIPHPSIHSVPEGYYRNPEWYEYRFTSSANHLKVLIFRDSFSNAMKKYLIESFGETVMIWHPEFDKELILQEKPDIVIYQIVERNLDFFLKYD